MNALAYFRGFLFLVLALGMSLAVRAAEVGTIQFAVGNIQIRDAAGKLRPVAKGAAVNEGDVILTAPSASAQIRMSDGAIIAVRPDTELRIDTYRFAGKEDGSESAVLSLLKGGMRTITGVIGRSNRTNYRLGTVTATIGIRGTDFEVYHTPAAGEKISPPLADALFQPAPYAESAVGDQPLRIMLAQAGSTRSDAPLLLAAAPPSAPPPLPPGTFNKVNVGATQLTGNLSKQSIVVTPGVTSGFTDGTRVALVPTPVQLRATPPVQQDAGQKPAPKEKPAADKPAAKPQAQAPAEGASETTGASTTSESPATQVRTTTGADTSATNPPVTTTATTPPSTNVAPSQTIIQPITASTSSSTNTLNLTTQTVVTSSGTAAPVGAASFSPPVVSSHYGHRVMGALQTPSGTLNYLSIYGEGGNTNTDFLLDSSRNLTEIGRSGFFAHDPDLGTPQYYLDARIRYTGGAGRDPVNDPAGVFHIGRWEGGQIDVTDNAGSLAPFIQLLGPGSAHWWVGLTPGYAQIMNYAGPVNNTQFAIGATSYSLLGATRPTDAAGNVGVLNSATLAANFTTQRVSTALNVIFRTGDSANVSSRNLDIMVNAPSIPITGAEFFDVQYGMPGSVSCSGADCSPNGYIAVIDGQFGSAASGTTTSGALGSSALLGYELYGETATLAEDQISGLALFGSSAAPVVGTTLSFPDNSRVRHDVRYLTNELGTTGIYNVNLRDAAPNLNTNYLFDAAGNLVRIFDTPYTIFDRSVQEPASITKFAVATPISNAMVSFGGDGGVAAERYAFVPPGGSEPIIRLGRWQGGAVSVLDLATDESYLEPLGNRSVHWLVRQGVPSFAGMSGTFHYTRIGDGAGNPSFATSPTDNYGNVGVLDRARLSVDFTRMTSSAGVSITMPAGPGGSLGTQVLGAQYANVPLISGGFNVSSNAADNPGYDHLHISCAGSGCAAPPVPGEGAYGGRIRGALAGNGAEGAYFRYTFNTRYPDSAAAAMAGRVFNEYSDGYVAFQRGPGFGPLPLTHPDGPSDVLATYSFNVPQFGTRTEQFSVRNPASLVTDASGNLLSVTSDDDFDDPRSLTLTQGTPSPATPLQAGNFATNGITLGWRSPSPGPLTVSGTDFAGVFSGREVLADGLAWVRGPAIYPAYLPGALSTMSNSSGLVVSGTANFILDGAVVRDQNGLGATGPVSASLTANFDQQAVAFNLTVPMSAGTWTASGSGVRMDDGGGFHANNASETVTPASPGTPSVSSNRQMFVSYSGGGSAFGNVSGQLTGPGVNGAAMVYNFSSSNGDRSLGALAFNNPTPYSDMTAYRLFGLAVGMNNLGAAPYNFDEENHRLIGGVLAPGRIERDALTGAPLRLDGEYPIAATPVGCTPCIPSHTQIPVTYAVAGATISPGPGGVAIAGTATAVNVGSDPSTGLVWGRYAGGTIGVTDRITGAALGTIDAAAQNMHFIMSSVHSGPVVLPVSGTFNYTPVGGTNPTNNLGAVGTLNAASLTANFTARTVDAAVNVTIGGATLNAAAAGMPIQHGAFFDAHKKLGVPNAPGGLQITHSTDPNSANLAGSLAGSFGGQTGNAAAVIYSINHGGHSTNTSIVPAGGVTTSGVVGFKR